MVLIDFEVIGDDAKLLARHFENVVLIDAQRRTHRFGGAEKGAPKSGICACCPVSSNRIRGRDSDQRRLGHRLPACGAAEDLAWPLGLDRVGRKVWHAASVPPRLRWL